MYPHLLPSEILILPSEGLSRPAIKESRVDFPQPEGPATETNSPSLTSRDMSFKTKCSPAGVLKLKDKF